MRRPPRHRSRRTVISIGAIAAGLVTVTMRFGPHATTSGTRPTPQTEVAFVGAAVCARCHPRQAEAWTGSHHQLAMQPATGASVLGDFADATFVHDGVTSRLFRRDAKYMVRTDGPDGALHDYEVSYAFGVAPLQQYLVELSQGRLQALEIAWDSRPKAAGGQRWFHLYPDEHIDHHDPLHWTGVAESWNYMCADCHSTNVRKSWSDDAQRYATTFAEVSVSCEACHGPGSRHVSWASQPPASRGSDDGLAIALDERAGVTWSRDPTTHKPVRSRPRTSRREIEMCARCHARRGLVHEDSVHGQPVTDDYDVALLADDLYYPDGQIKGEVYEYGSFVQSRMFAEGVTCSDCHDPHRPELRAAPELRDGTCLRCHAPEQYQTPKHHFHPEASAGARCVACHMPAVTYMVVDPRRDHSLRVPRPDLSVTLGVPNPCNQCHADRTATWAATTVASWYGHPPSGLQQFAEALAAGSKGAPGADQLLAALVADHGQPAIARASAIARLERVPTPPTLPVIRDALGDADPLVRRAAIHAIAGIDPGQRVAAVAPLLADPVRTVRIEAARAMVGVPADLIPPSSREPLARAMSELFAAYQLNGDRPEAQVALATIDAGQGAFDRAEAELQRALALDPAFAPASVNLADLYRALGRDAQAEPVLRRALARAPDDPALLHALGLVLVRERRIGEALEPLAAAARLGADNPRYGYVYSVALHDANKVADALRELDTVLRRHPYDRDSLSAMVAFRREAGQPRDALRFAEQLEQLEPQDTNVRALLQQLRSSLVRP
jgi:tetratricopeptide (TPR) repeat protein